MFKWSTDWFLHGKNFTTDEQTLEDWYYFTKFTMAKVPNISKTIFPHCEYWFTGQIIITISTLPLKELSLIFKHPEPHLKLIKYVCIQLYEVLSLLFGGKIVTIPCYFYTFTFWRHTTDNDHRRFDIQTKVLWWRQPLIL